MGTKKYYEEHKDKIIKRITKYNKTYRRTPMGKAINLLCRYNEEDEKRRGCKGDITAQWIVDNIFTKPCAHCGESDWTKIGCNRLDNSKPHTIDNVEPCCRKCNAKLRGEDVKKERSKTVYQYDKITKELLGVYENAEIAEKNIKGVYQSNISKCCLGKLKTTGGYIFSYKPL